MNLKILTLIVLIGVFNVNALSPVASYIHQRAEDALQEQMIKSLSTPMLRSTVSSCHPQYSELLATILETYENDRKKCEDNENEQLVALASEGQQSRDDTTIILNNVCESLEGCKGKTENLDFFDCVNQSGDKNTRNIWKASKDSSDIAARIREQIHVIQYQTGRCNSEAERKYVVATTKATDDMMACYAGVSPPPPSTEAPSTEAPSTEAPSTDAPSTDAPSTEAPSTDAPSTEGESTDAPSTEGESTDAPSTEGESTDASSTEGESTDASSTEGVSTDAPSTEGESTVAPSTEGESTEAPSTDDPSDEMDQVEELEDVIPQSRLDNLMKYWRKRF